MLVGDLVLRTAEPGGAQVILVLLALRPLLREAMAPGRRAQGAGPALREDASGTVTWDSVEPEAVRLALLAHAHREPFIRTTDRLADAERTLRHWRHAVADWARSPSGAVPDQVRLRARAAFADDLDTPKALALLHRVEKDAGIPVGAKFDIFAAVDRVLAS